MVLGVDDSRWEEFEAEFRGGSDSGRGQHRSPRRRKEQPAYVRPLLGLLTIAAIALIVGIPIGMFRGSFTRSVPVTVLSSRAGLVMNTGAKVKMRGVQVGQVDSIEAMPDGRAALHLAIDPAQRHLIPANSVVDITSSTVFGAKFVELVAPENPSPQSVQAGQVLDGQHVMVETNTLFQRLTSVLSSIDPIKLNEMLGAMSKGVNGKGHDIGQMIDDFNDYLAVQETALPALSHDLAVLPVVANAYGDAGDDLTRTAGNAVRISQSIVDEQKNLNAFLLSSIGMADVGNDVIGGNKESMASALHLLRPTTDLTNDYHKALWCGLAGMAQNLKGPPLPDPGVSASVGFELGAERFRYPTNLPKVAATGGPQCHSLPIVPYDTAPPFVVADVGANPFAYGNPQVLINSDGLKQLLYGPIDGPPRNVMQINQPG